MAMFEFSLHCNFYFRRKSEEDREYFNDLKDTKFRQLLYHIQGKEKFSNGDRIFQDYVAIRQPHVLFFHASRNRSFIFQEQIKLFETCFKNNIQLTMYKRLVAFFSKVPAQPGQLPITKQLTIG